VEADDQGALVTFSHALMLGAGLTTDVAAVRRALDETQPAGDTSLAF